MMPVEKSVAKSIDGVKANPACLAALLIVAIFSVLNYVKESRLADSREAIIAACLNKGAPQ